MNKDAKFHPITNCCRKCKTTFDKNNHKGFRRDLIQPIDGDWFFLWYYSCPKCKCKTLFLKEDTSEDEEMNKIYSIGM